MKRIYISLLICICAITVQAQTIAGYEYWFDSHFDNRSAQNTASGSVSIEKDITDFSPGLHLLNFRIKNSEGFWIVLRFRRGCTHSTFAPKTSMEHGVAW